MEGVIIAAAFILAAGYLGKLVYRSFRGASGCGSSGCGKCNTIDFDKIEKQVKTRGIVNKK